MRMHEEWAGRGRSARPIRAGHGGHDPHAAAHGGLRGAGRGGPGFPGVDPDDSGRGHPGGRGGRGGFGRGGPGRGGGRRGWGRESAPPPDTEGLAGWLAGRLPEGWFEGMPELTVDRDEITVVGTLPAPELAEGATAADIAEAEAGRISRFREDSREQRMAVAREAEHRFGRALTWGAVSGGTRQLFTTLSVPVMTRLRQADRQVLDTLVDSGVARSRSDALAWCVRLVGENTGEWLGELREAMERVQAVRENGPRI